MADLAGVPDWLTLLVTDEVARLELGSGERRTLVETAAHVLPRAARIFVAADWAVMEVRLGTSLGLSSDRTACVAALLADIDARVADMAAVAQEASS